jgi:hypothetical protein
VSKNKDSEGAKEYIMRKKELYRCICGRGRTSISVV